MQEHTAVSCGGTLTGHGKFHQGEQQALAWQPEWCLVMGIEFGIGPRLGLHCDLHCISLAHGKGRRGVSWLEPAGPVD